MTEPAVVVVTGASGGIGRAVARAFAQRGADVALLARGEAGLAAAKEEIETIGRRALAIPTDVADAAQVDAAAAQVERDLGPIDVWVNNAMVTIFSPFADVTPDEFRRATDVTYLGTVWGTRAALTHMRPRDRGTIVQVGSALAYRAIPLQSPYCGAKFAIRGFTDSLRSELLRDRSRIRITMVQLSAFNTPQFDWGRSHMPRRAQPVPPIFQPEVAADAIVWAAKVARREVWIGFPAVRTILAQVLAPAPLDRMLARMGYEGQMTDEPLPPDHVDNLFRPVGRDHGAHGRFDAPAKKSSFQLWLNMHRRDVTLATLAIVAVAAILFT